MRVCKLLTTLLVRTEFMGCSAESSHDDESDNTILSQGHTPHGWGLGTNVPKRVVFYHDMYI